MILTLELERLLPLVLSIPEEGLLHNIFNLIAAVELILETVFPPRGLNISTTKEGKTLDGFADLIRGFAD